jgi:hypothetical protein
MPNVAPMWQLEVILTNVQIKSISNWLKYTDLYL